MSSAGAAPRAAVSVSSARAEASRRNGAQSRGPRTAEGKARSARNALKHGLRAEKYVVLPDEDRGEFAALEAALLDELAPDGVFQRILAGRIVCAAWRLMRAERLEVELFGEHHILDGSLGLALIRDGNGTRSFETLLRYRGAAQAELWRALRTLKALQAEGAGHGRARTAEPAPAQVFETNPRQGSTVIAPDRESRHPARRAQPNEPETRLEPGEPAPAGPPVQGLEQLTPRPRHLRPNEPDSRRNPRGCDPVTVQRSPGAALAPRQLTVAD
jgi:hypothetical protein